MSWFDKLVHAAGGWPEPFVRQPRPIAHTEGWYTHDGGECPVKPDTRCGVSAGTYASLDGTGLLQFTAGKAEWEHRKVGHLRNDINAFCVIDHLPQRDKNILAEAAKRYAEKQGKS